MKEVTVILEREGNVLRVVSDLAGFYLWGTDAERVFSSIIPLAQHCVWRNSQMAMMPKEDLDIQKLLEDGSVTITFEFVEHMKEPPMLVDGGWWESPEGVHFFSPCNDAGEMDEKTMMQILGDLNPRAIR